MPGGYPSDDMRVGFIGVGAQGRPLALNLLVAGYPLHIHDPDPAATRGLVEAGAILFDSAARVARESDLVLVCVASDAQLLAVVGGEQGLLRGAAAGLIVAVHSTVAPATIADVAEQCRSQRVHLLDAPVSGGPAGAQARAMTYIVGGDDAILARCEPVFALSGSTIIRTGSVGSATLAKLAHQIAMCATIVGVAEAFAFAESGGIGREAMRQILCSGAARSLVAECWNDGFFPGNAASLLTKDLRHAADWAEAHGLPLPATLVAEQRIAGSLPLSGERNYADA